MNRKLRLQQIARGVGFQNVMVEHHHRGHWRVLAYDHELPRLFEGKGGWRPITGIVSYEQAQEQIRQQGKTYLQAYPGMRCE